MNASQTSTTFKLSPTRYFFYWWGMFVIGYQVLGLIVSLSMQNSSPQTAFQQPGIYGNPTWWYSSIFFATCFGMGLLIRMFFFKKVYEITITDETFEGQGWSTIRKPLSMVDRKRTMQKHFFEKLFWYRNIWFSDGKKFELHEYALRVDEVKMILKKLGCE